MAVLAVLLAAVAACGDDPEESFQVQNDSPNPAFVIITTSYGRNVYAIEPQSAVVLGNFNSQDGDIEVLGPTCAILATFGAPETQRSMFEPRASAWLGNYQITIPKIGSPTVARPTTFLDLPAVRGAVLDPNKADEVACPPVTVPGALPQG